MVQGYCVKCKEKVNLKDAVIVKTSRGGFMAKGSCPATKNTVCAMMSEEVANKAMKSGEAKKGF